VSRRASARGGTGAERHPHRDRVAVLATKHEKGPLIGPPLARAVGLSVRPVVVDTDRFGTFSGEVPRPGSAWDTAVAKARHAMAVTGVDLGLASEGTFAPPPGLPWGVVATELVVLVDDELDLVVGETAVSYDVVTVSALLAAGEDGGPTLAAGAVPNHHLIVRPAAGPGRPLFKGVADGAALAHAVEVCATVSPDGRARVETDLRAHLCPSRRPVIERAASALGDRLARRCGACGTPGWGRIALELGVPCSWCGAEVGLVRAQIMGCGSCPHRWVVPVGPAQADPGRCPSCNP